jgi:hypothetical protein
MCCMCIFACKCCVIWICIWNKFYERKNNTCLSFWKSKSICLLIGDYHSLQFKLYFSYRVIFSDSYADDRKSLSYYNQIENCVYLEISCLKVGFVSFDSKTKKNFKECFILNSSWIQVIKIENDFKHKRVTAIWMNFLLIFLDLSLNFFIN